MFNYIKSLFSNNDINYNYHKDTIGILAHYTFTGDVLRYIKTFEVIVENPIYIEGYTVVYVSDYIRVFRRDENTDMTEIEYIVYFHGSKKSVDKLLEGLQKINVNKNTDNEVEDDEDYTDSEVDDNKDSEVEDNKDSEVEDYENSEVEDNELDDNYIKNSYDKKND